ncbi:MAG: hypothetical protein Q4A41_04190 [Bacillota bacterium]|nr:hypothetical protein [Bacillota bacterium]
MAKKMELVENSTENLKFEKKQIINSERYEEDRDLLSALLDDTELYSLEEVDVIIEKFKKRRIS